MGVVVPLGQFTFDGAGYVVMEGVEDVIVAKGEAAATDSTSRRVGQRDWPGSQEGQQIARTRGLERVRAREKMRRSCKKGVELSEWATK